MEKVITNQFSSRGVVSSRVSKMGNVDRRRKASAEKLTSEMAETNEDSSYDSDFETDETYTAEPAVVSRSSSAGLSSHHDVSRTVSDTLGAEFAEYVNTEQSFEDVKKSPLYTTRLEFGLKLGYSDALIQTALVKLNPEPSNNELLEELIKLSSATSKGGAAFKEDFIQETHISNVQTPSLLRHIVIDGSNVAMSHGNSRIFSCKGIKICVDWFRERGHPEITVFVPKWRKESCSVDNQIKDQEILKELEKERLLVYTPSRLVSGKRYVCYDDRYILKLAAQVDGIVVSNDNYKDLLQENAEFRKVVEERILMFSFVNDRFMPPDDPMGRNGPNLDTFLSTKFKRPEQLFHCPYGRKCTYGNKCRYHHPERGNLPQKSVADQLSEYVNKKYNKNSSKELHSKPDLKTMSLPLSCENQGAVPKKMPLSRTRSAAPAPALPVMDPIMQASMVSNFNRAQMEYQHPPPHLEYHMPPSGPIEPPYKSHSIDNLASSFQDFNLLPVAHSSSQNLNYSQQNIWASPDTSPRGEVPWNANRYGVNNQEPQPEAANMHRKLHRQLTLNPNYDPRLYRMHGGNNLNPQGNMWTNHPTVGRMASDPTAGPSWGSHQSAWGNSPMDSRAEARTRTHYLLLGIFPEDKVHKAMSLLPDETDPQKICAFILSHS